MPDAREHALAALGALTTHAPVRDAAGTVHERELGRLVERLDGAPWRDHLRRPWYRAMLRLQLDALARSDHTFLQRVEHSLARLRARLLADLSPGKDDHSVERVRQDEWFKALLEVNALAVDLLQPGADGQWIVSGSLVEQILRLLAENPGASNADLLRLLGRGKEAETQVSRALAKLRSRGLAVRGRSGLHGFWDLTPRGRQVALNLRRAAARTRSPSGPEQDWGQSNSNRRTYSVRRILAQIDSDLAETGHGHEVEDDSVALVEHAFGHRTDPIDVNDVAEAFSAESRNVAAKRSRSLVGGL